MLSSFCAYLHRAPLNLDTNPAGIKLGAPTQRLLDLALYLLRSNVRSDLDVVGDASHSFKLFHR